MKRLRASRRAWALAFVLVFASLALWWWFAPPRGSLPIGRLLPARLSAAVRLSNLESAWQAHWLRREAAPEQALREILESLGKWDRWREKYGDQGAELRLDLYQQALFQAVGEEAWITFGEWGAAPAGAGRGGGGGFPPPPSPLRNPGGPLMERLIDDLILVTHTHRGVTIYEYRDRRIDRSFTFCHVGGWISASLQQRGLGPLPAIIDAAARPARAAERPGALVRRLTGDPANPALAAAWWPADFWGHLRQFRFQRGEALSEKSQRRLDYWSQRLDGVDSLELTQAGPTLFDLRLDLIGPRPAQLAEEFAAPPVAAADAGATTTAPRLPRIGQFDLSLPFAVAAAPLAGLSTEALLDKATLLDLWAPGLRDLLRNELADRVTAPPGRIGLALYPGSLPFMPGVRAWLDRPPLQSSGQSPAAAWEAGAVPGANDTLAWLQPAAPVAGDAATTGPSVLAAAASDPWHGFERSAWGNPLAAPPLLFATISFRRFDAELARLPVGLLGEKQRKRIERARAIVRALSYAAAGAALRLDPLADRWRLDLRVPG